MEPPIHVPVLANEVLEWLEPLPGQTILDGTLGGGGHTRLLAQRVGLSGRIIAVDRDPKAVRRAERSLSGLPVEVAHASYLDLPEIVASLSIRSVDGILLDLGLSSDQLADGERGFSYDVDGDLDLRFDPTEGEPAWRILARISAEHLADVIYKYGEERYSRRIARRVIEARRKEPIRTARQLADLVRGCVPRSRNHRIDPATRTFQALRIAVNHELDAVEQALERLPDLLHPSARLAVISFHSLEDRLVKQAFRRDRRLQNLTPKPVVADASEQQANRRSRSAKLRVAMRVIP